MAETNPHQKPHPDQQGAHPEAARKTGQIVAGPEAREASKEETPPEPPKKG